MVQQQRTMLINQIIEWLEITCQIFLEQVSGVVLLETRIDNSSGHDPVIPVKPRTHKYYPCSPFNWRLTPFFGSKTVGGSRPRERLWKKKISSHPPNTHTYTQIQTQKYPSKYQMVFLESVSFFHDQKKKKKTTPKKHAFCILGYRSIQPPLRSRKDEYQVRHDSENSINNWWCGLANTKTDEQKKVCRTAKMRCLVEAIIGRWMAECHGTIHTWFRNSSKDILKSWYQPFYTITSSL